MRSRTSALIAVLLLFVIPSGCGGGGGSDEEAEGDGDGKEAAARTASGGEEAGGEDGGREASGRAANGRIIMLDDGKITSVKPDGSDRKAIEGPAVSGGMSTSAPGVAILYIEDDADRLVVVDTAKGTAKVLTGVGVDGSFPPQLGRRYAVLGGSLAIDLEAAEVVPLPAIGDNPQLQLSPDQRFVLARVDRSLRLIALDGAKETTIPGISGLFSPSGPAVFTYEADDQKVGTVRKVPLEGGDGEIVAQGAGVIIHGVAGDSAVVLEGEDRDIYSLAAKEGDRRKIDVPLAEGGSIDFVRLSSARFALLADPDAKEYFLLDLESASAKPLEGLSGLHHVFGEDDRYVYFSSFAGDQAPPEAGVAGRFGLLDLEKGTVQTTSFDPGERAIYLPPPILPQVSPDGAFLAVSLQPGPEQDYAAAILPWDGGDPVEIKGLFAGWSPDGSSLLVVRHDDPDNPHFFAVSADGKDEVDLGTGTGAIWTAG